MPQTFAAWYKLPAPDAKTLAQAVYGLPELYAHALPNARIVEIRDAIPLP